MIDVKKLGEIQDVFPKVKLEYGMVNNVWTARAEGNVCSATMTSNFELREESLVALCLQASRLQVRAKK